MSKHTITFYPLGNADSTLIKLSAGKTVLFDYANMRCADDPNDKRIDLPKALDEAVTGNFDVVCFTHADDDHICGFSEYFYLEHAGVYQTGKRKKIKELWVPAAVLLEPNVDGEARILRSEARHRLKAGKGIRVFSRPKKMRDWCDEQEDICFDDVEHLFVNAGTLAPGFGLSSEGIEFFVHSPFASESQNINRNREAIVVQANFDDNCQTKVMLGSDINSEVWADIVKVTRHFKRDERLEWDIFHISHHCSYTALNGEKGVNETLPTAEVKWLFETQGKNGSRIISPSKPTPVKGTKEDEDVQPPHRQAANYYKRVANLKRGEFKVTMEHPNATKPEPIAFEIDKFSCATLIKKAVATSAFVSTIKPPRAG